MEAETMTNELEQLKKRLAVIDGYASDPRNLPLRLVDEKAMLTVAIETIESQAATIAELRVNHERALTLCNERMNAMARMDERIAEIESRNTTPAPAVDEAIEVPRELAMQWMHDAFAKYQTRPGLYGDEAYYIAQQAAAWDRQNRATKPAADDSELEGMLADMDADVSNGHDIGPHIEVLRALFHTIGTITLKPTHSDDAAVDKFAAMMKAKLAKARDKGRGGWEGCDPTTLTEMMLEHLRKGDPVDVANFCMFLSLTTGSIDTAVTAPAKAEVPPQAVSQQLTEVIDGLSRMLNHEEWPGGQRAMFDLRERLPKLSASPPSTPSQPVESAKCPHCKGYGDIEDSMGRFVRHCYCPAGNIRACHPATGEDKP